MQIDTLLQQAKQRLNTPTSSLDAEVLLCFLLDTDRSWVLAHSDELLTDDVANRYRDLVLQRASGMPIAYLTGTKEFYGRNFAVNKKVLIPRPESESFIALLRGLKNDQNKHGFLHSVLDIGTGSGCMAITAKLEFADTYVTATDTSATALKVAIQNARTLHADIVFKKQSLLTGDKQGYDVILANLPYVPDTMKDPSIMNEPSKALFSGSDGLDHYRDLFAQLATKHIRFVMTESLLSQHNNLAKLAASASYELYASEGLVQVFRKTPYSY